MANVQSPRGFVPSRYANGSPFNGAGNLYYIPSTDGLQYNVGDAVKSGAGGSSTGIPQVVKAAGTDTVRGVIMGVMVAPQNENSFLGANLDLTVQNIPASKQHDYYVLVADDPAILFELQGDGTATNQVAASCNKNASFTVTNPTTPQQNSASTLNSASIATTAALNLKIFGLVQQSRNNEYGAYANWLVKFNQHELQGNTAGV